MRSRTIDRESPEVDVVDSTGPTENPRPLDLLIYRPSTLDSLDPVGKGPQAFQVGRPDEYDCLVTKNRSHLFSLLLP